MTNYETHSTVNPDFDINLSNSDSDIDKNLFSWNFGFYQTFGTKYPYNDAIEDVTEKESTEEITNAGK